jgi:hypothetical protein
MSDRIDLAGDSLACGGFRAPPAGVSRPQDARTRLRDEVGTSTKIAAFRGKLARGRKRFQRAV